MNNNEKSISDLLKILLDNIDKLDTGLCSLSFNLWRYYKLLTITEEQKLNQYIYDNCPIIKIISFKRNNYYWKKGLKEPRIKWLNKHIKKLKN